MYFRETVKSNETLSKCKDFLFKKQLKHWSVSIKWTYLKHLDYFTNLKHSQKENVGVRASQEKVCTANVKLDKEVTQV